MGKNEILKLKTKKFKVEAFSTQHWSDGKPTGVWWLGKRERLDNEPKDFFWVFHEEAEYERAI